MVAAGCGHLWIKKSLRDVVEAQAVLDGDSRGRSALEWAI